MSDEQRAGGDDEEDWLRVLQNRVPKHSVTISVHDPPQEFVVKVEKRELGWVFSTLGRQGERVRTATSAYELNERHPQELEATDMYDVLRAIEEGRIPFEKIQQGRRYEVVDGVLYTKTGVSLGVVEEASP